jgi:cell division protein FtsA
MRRADVNFVCGVDVGTTKVCVVVGEVNLAGELAIAGVGVVPSQGLQRGVVVDRQLATAAIRRAVQQAEASSGIRVARAYLGVTGGHLSCVNVRGRASVTGPQVTPAEVEQALASACESVPLTSDRRIVHRVVRQFWLDGERGIKRPLGMVGRQLDVELHVVTGRGSVVDNLVACVEEAGVQVAAVMLEAQATAQAVLTEAEQQLGCVLVDIGGGTTDLAVFADGAICHTSAFPCAGNHVTMDLAKLLRLTPAEAEQIKRRWGHALASEVSEDEYVPVRVVGTGEEEHIPRRLIAEIIQARMEEILERVGERLTEHKLWAYVPAGLVLSGGGAQLPGLTRLATTVLQGLPARIGAPQPLGGHFELVKQPMYATGVGLALMAAAEKDWCSRRLVPRRLGAARWWQGLHKLWQRALEHWHRWHASRAR